MFKTNIDEIPESGISRSYRDGISIRYLILEEFGAPNFEMRYFELDRGALSAQDHHESEHEVFVVRGRGKLHLKDRTVELKPKDAIFIDSWEHHQFEQVGEEPFGFLCIVPNGVSKSKREVSLDYGEHFSESPSPV